MGSGDAPGLGLDRLSITFPVRGIEDDPSVWDQVSVAAPGTPDAREARSVTIRQDGYSVYLGAVDIQGVWWLKAEGNPSRFVDPEGCSLVDLDAAGWAARRLASVAANVAAPAGPLDSARVKRVDVARDFRGVTSPSRFVRGLLGVHRPYARRSFIYHDPAKGNAQTLYAGSGAGGARLYDQHEAYAAKGAPEGALRWEVEARSDWLERISGVRTVGDLDAQALGRLADDRWGWSSMGTEVVGTDALVERVMSAQWDGMMTAREAEKFVGWVVLHSRGMALWPASKSTASKYRRWVRDLGVALEPDGGAQGCTMRLDWDEGREVMALAT